MFNIGDKIRFGRANGEHTLAEVVKVNQKTVKARQLEARGRYPAGTIWNVAIAYATKVDDNTVTTSKPTLSPVAKVEGMTFVSKALLLGLPTDCQGKEILLNGRSYSIVDIEITRRENPVVIRGARGGQYIAPVKRILEALNVKPATNQASPFPKGTDVLILSWNKKWWERGVVVSDTMVNDKVSVLTNLGTFNVKQDEIKVCPKRTEKEILQDIADCYCSLSPENISCDGERPRSQINKRRSELSHFLGVLFKEIGREVSEMEACCTETGPCFKQ